MSASANAHTDLALLDADTLKGYLLMPPFDGCNLQVSGPTFPVLSSPLCLAGCVVGGHHEPLDLARWSLVGCLTRTSAVLLFR